jgi:uncharacterized membrane protein YkvA (DUF1232 family)
MSQLVDTEKAKEVLNSEMENAKGILENPEQMNEVLRQVDAKLASVPILKNYVTDLPVMVDLVKSYITKEYTNISPKVVLALVGSFLYMIKKKDIIPDSVPIIGMLDDLAVFGLALQISKPELNAFSEWKNGKA